ncbi:PREDICTED: putative uncharacterized protein DDB_G0277255 [Habropoda laboriosa]|uniref:putative uncharacterized protein DDB_G0277255 n=1 Tax=Habropoda laboriosa TaxID=597456 RepID=UPI00083E2501|nr:PREDICTED: putative uncharacterized protein DDB_G0277255 [Habropoda laboriosa]
MSISQSENTIQTEQQKCKRRKKLSKENINNKIEAQKNLNSSGSNRNKQEVKDKKKKVSNRINKNVSNSRQMSLKESFLNHSKIKLLRSHKNSKNSKNDSTLVKERSTKRVSVMKRKQPIYDCVSPENPKESTNEIYEFKFDINDSKERLPKKQKRKVTIKKTLINKKKKNVVNSKRNLQETKVRKKTSITGELEKIKEKDPVESVQNKMSVEPLSKKEDLVENPEPDVEENPKPDVEENRDSKESENIIKEQNEDKKIMKPVILSIKKLNDKRILLKDMSQISNSADFKPFRPTSVFNNRLTIQQKNVINSSLFEKSLSPIMKLSENLQINSPWRASPLLTFSQVKNMFQSTPQSKKYNIVSKNFVRSLNDESKQYGNILKARNNLQKNDKNMSIENSTTNTPKKKNTLPSRKFGTEITNIDHSLHANPIEHVNEQVVVENVSIQSNVHSITSNMNDSIRFNNNENKTKNTLSPKKSFKKEAKETKFQNHQESILNTQADELKENLDPQPGPSGLQILPISNEQRVLRQSNLNNFLNIMDMPQNTTITTPHGIFDYGQSTALSSRSVIKLNESNMEIKNAFGFNDEDSNQDISSVEYKIINDKEEENKSIQTNLGQYNTKPTARLSIGEIKNKLLVKKLKKNVQNEIKEIKKSPIKERNEQKIVDITNFSDTFDVLSETNETSVVDVSEIPLFTDMEPSHFTTPPRYSYKRKRAVRFSFSEGSEGEEVFIKQEKKRNKNDKLKKEQNKRLMEWVKDINATFSEIDQHELTIV